MGNLNYEMDEYGNVRAVGGNAGGSAGGGSAEENIAALKEQLSRPEAAIKTGTDASRLGLGRGIAVSIGMLVGVLKLVGVWIYCAVSESLNGSSVILMIWSVIEYALILYCVTHKKYDGAFIFSIVSILTALMFYLSYIQYCRIFVLF